MRGGARGLKVWQDRSEVEDFQSITRAVREGLARSRVLVAFYSRTYPMRRACQWELTAALLSATTVHGSAVGRVLVVNPEKEMTHVHPIELRDAKVLQLLNPTAPWEVEQAAHSIDRHLSGVEGTIGSPDEGAVRHMARAEADFFAPLRRVLPADVATSLRTDRE